MIKSQDEMIKHNLEEMAPIYLQLQKLEFLIKVEIEKEKINSHILLCSKHCCSEKYEISLQIILEKILEESKK